MILTSGFGIRLSEDVKSKSIVQYEKGKIWDIACDVTEVEDIYKNLLNYRANQQEEIKEIANRYKDKFYTISR